MTDIQTTLDSRQASHGDFTENARISQALKGIAYNSAGYAKLDDVEVEALQMIALKESRILSGEPHFEDHWRDIAGYAMLVANHLAGRRNGG